MLVAGYDFMERQEGRDDGRRSQKEEHNGQKVIALPKTTLGTVLNSSASHAIVMANACEAHRNSIVACLVLRLRACPPVVQHDHTSTKPELQVGARNTAGATDSYPGRIDQSVREAICSQGTGESDQSRADKEESGNSSPRKSDLPDYGPVGSTDCQIPV